MNLLRVKSEEDALQDIKQFINIITGISADEVETETTFRVWLGHDGENHKAMGIQMDKIKYPDGYQYKAYTALLHNVTIMMADYTAFLMWVIDINRPESLKK